MQANRLAFRVIVFFCLHAAHSASLRPGETADILRGYSCARLCIRTDQSPAEWCVRFRQVIIRKEAKNSSAFLLGANFGFSFKSESTAESSGANEDELRKVAACAANARL